MPVALTGPPASRHTPRRAPKAPAPCGSNQAPAAPCVPREVWPEGEVFGPADVEPEDELELLKQILHATLPRESLHDGQTGTTLVPH